MTVWDSTSPWLGMTLARWCLSPGWTSLPTWAEFRGHEITARRQRNNVTKVTFKNVPLNIPDEEILHLCETYGKPVDFQVQYERLNNFKNKGMVGGTRSVDVEMFTGASMFNFYWMEGPLAGDEGCRVTVLHPGQTQQCSNCLRLASGCPAKGNGKACVATGTPRTQIATYMDIKLLCFILFMKN